MKKPFKRLWKSFGYALRGIGLLFKSERNAQIHLCATVVVLSAGLYFELNSIEWCVICLTIGLVLVAEGINTAIERTMDLITEERKPQIAHIKDLSAGATLIAAIIAVAVAAFIFSPKISLVF